MHIDKFKQDDGTYLDAENCLHENAEDFLSSFLDFCGCGMLEKALRYIRDVLTLLRDGKSFEWIEQGRARARLSPFFGDQGEAYTVWYLLHAKGMEEHGGSTPGWLTTEGEELLDDLEELYGLAKDDEGGRYHRLFMAD